MIRRDFYKNPYFFLILALILFFPAYLINLGDQPMIEDEAIRSIVAFEMHKSGDLITPTIGGDPYLRKPPLFNWLIAGSFALTGSYSETSVRLPMIISLLLFSLTIFFFVKKEMGTRMGVINALIFMTLGRIIIFESLHGLIDITFSWFTYLLFMSSYFLFKKDKFLLLFITAYLITAMTWLMKGIPAIVFLGISLLVLFISGKKFRLLFNWRHFVGISIFILIIGAYYLVYFLRNDISPEELFNTLLGQTTRRTAIRYGFLNAIKHLFTFPFDMLYHFLPWSILVLVLFIKGSLKRVMAHPFLKYNLLLLLFNIIPYWTSPEVYPRYILMLTPLFFTVLTWIYFIESEKNNKLIRILEYVFGTLIVIGFLIPYASFFFEITRKLDQILLISILFSIAMAAISILYWKQVSVRIFWVAIAMLVIRIGFDFIILPTRPLNSPETMAKESAAELADLTAGHDLFSYFNPELEPHFYNNRSVIHFRYHYYLCVARNEIVYTTTEKKPGAIYFSEQKHVGSQPIELIGYLDQHYDDSVPMPVFRFEMAVP